MATKSKLDEADKAARRRQAAAAAASRLLVDRGFAGIAISADGRMAALSVDGMDWGEAAKTLRHFALLLDKRRKGPGNHHRKQRHKRETT